MGVIFDLYKAYSESEGKEKALPFLFRMLGLDASVLDGGPGSGNFGHKGRPGEVGGSGKGGGKAFRTQQAGKYISVAKTKAFKNLVKKAQSTSDYNSFVHGITPEQTQLIKDQFKQCGTKERFSDYVERLRHVLVSAKLEKRVPYKMVEGKDRTQECVWDYEPYKESQFGQLIDTEIEHVIAKQGFNGVPKVVSQEELEKIIEEHPEMPVLFRSYAADPDTLQDYDDMLENGEWYVDCGVGGAQYGQGMYCAGVYGENKDYSHALTEMQHYRSVSMKRSRDRWCPELGDREDCISAYGKAYVFSIDEFKNTESKQPEIGKDVISTVDGQFVKGYFMPEDPEDDNSDLEFTYYVPGYGFDTVSADKAKYWAPISRAVDPPAQEASTRMMTLDPSSKIVTYKDAQLLYEGKMTKDQRKEFYRKRLDWYREYWDKYEYSDDEKFLAEYAYKSALDLLEEDDRKKYLEVAQRYSDEDLLKDIMDNGKVVGQDTFQHMRSVEREQAEKTKEIRARYNNIGSYMAALGYDAINAEGHGESDSYTVVLNRTKLILSNQRVDV